MRKLDLNNFQVARSETARDINRRIVLNLIRKSQPISRASLARRSGLQRSTVSAITEQLISERWVAEGAVGYVPRGRKPTFLHLNTERCGIVGVDIRPCATTVAVAGLDSHLVAQESMSTGSPEEFLPRLGRRICDLMRAHPRSSYEGIGVSLPGRIHPTTQRLIFAPGLGWGDEVDVKSSLERATGLPVELENAANACALAELWSGRHGETVRNIVAITVYEGIGMGLIINGQLVKGAAGVAGEFGHVTVVEDGPACRCGSRGCLEMFASNSAAVRFYSESTTVRRGEVGGKSAMARLTFEDMLRLMEQGDSKACKAVDQMARYLGQGIAMIISGLAPDVIVVVGEVTRVWERVGRVVEATIGARALTHAGTRVLPANSDLQPRLRGTIALVLQKHFGVPPSA